MRLRNSFKIANKIKQRRTKLSKHFVPSYFFIITKGSALGQRCIRQHVIGDYIVDSLFRKSKVVVEIDGGYHFTPEQQRDDAIRQNWLEHQGYKVIRFTNEQILFDTDNVIRTLREKLTNI